MSTNTVLNAKKTEHTFKQKFGKLDPKRVVGSCKIVHKPQMYFHIVGFCSLFILWDFVHFSHCGILFTFPLMRCLPLPIVRFCRVGLC